MKKISDLNDLMIEQLRDLYHGAIKLDDLLSEMIEKASEEKLKTIFEDCKQSNKAQVMRIRQVFELLYVQKRGEICDAMNAMVKETEDLIKRSLTSEVRDAALITALQHIIHYRLAGYGAVCTYAQMLDFENIAELIHQNLVEEKLTDKKLIDLAEEQINLQAIG